MAPKVVGDKANYSRENRFVTETDEDGCRDSHCGTETCHCLKDATEAPCHEQHLNAAVGGNHRELALDNLHLASEQEGVITEYCHQDDDEDRRYCLCGSIEEGERHIVERHAKTKDCDHSSNNKGDETATVAWLLEHCHQQYKQCNRNKR